MELKNNRNAIVKKNWKSCDLLGVLNFPSIAQQGSPWQPVRRCRPAGLRCRPSCCVPESQLRGRSHERPTGKEVQASTWREQSQVFSPVVMATGYRFCSSCSSKSDVYLYCCSLQTSQNERKNLLFSRQTGVVSHISCAQHVFFRWWPVSAHRHLWHAQSCRQHHHHPQWLRGWGREEIPCLVVRFSLLDISVKWHQRLFIGFLSTALAQVRGPMWSAVSPSMTLMTRTRPPAAPSAQRPPHSQLRLWLLFCRLWRVSLEKAQTKKLQQVQVLLHRSLSTLFNIPVSLNSGQNKIETKLPKNETKEENSKNIYIKMIKNTWKGNINNSNKYI